MAKKSIPLTQEYLKSVLDYNPVTGVFTWKPRPISYFIHERAWKIFNTKFANRTAGGKTADGYITILVNGRMNLAHRLAWFYMLGEWPPQIDHRDTNKSNNKWNNLRKATGRQNLCNQGKSKANTSGYKGVSFIKNRGKFRAAISVYNKTYSLGYYSTAEEAYAVYCKEAKRLAGEFARF